MIQNFSNMINSIMHLVESGDTTTPFIICQGVGNGKELLWLAESPPAESLQKTLRLCRETDPCALVFTGSDFAKGSAAYVYDKVLCLRLYEEFNINRLSGDYFENPDNVRAMLSFFEENIGGFSHKVVNYLTTLEKPLAALMEMCPIDIALEYEDWDYDDDLTYDAIDLIESGVNERLGYQESPVINAAGTVDETYENNKINENGTAHILSAITLNGYIIDLGEDTKHEQPFYVETRKGGDTGERVFDIRMDNYTDALKAYSDQILGIAQEMRLDKNVDYKKLTASDCLQGSKNADFTKQLIIVDSAALLPEYRSSTSQLIECTHGNGARPDAIGRSVFGKELYSGASVAYDRSNILGIADEDKLPQWMFLSI